MSAPVPVSVNGSPVRSLVLRYGTVGPWVADVELTSAPELAGRVTLQVGDATLSGTLVAQPASPFGLAFGARIVAGGGGWGSLLPRKGYHNDAGVKASLVAADAAREAGEQIGTFAPAAERLGADYARPVATASSTLEHAAGGVPWFVDFAGVTHVTEHYIEVMPSGWGELLDFSERTQIATLGVDRVSALLIGAQISNARLGASPRTIRDVELRTANNSPLRATVWLGGSARDAARLPGLIRSMVERVVERRLDGLYRYRVAAMRGDKRVDLQAVRAAAGLPDLQAISQWPGIPGAAATIALGCEVLVQFIDGDPASPVLTHYAGPGGSSFAPTGLILGGDAGEPAARQGDPVEVLLPPAVFAGTVNGLPATGTVSWLVPKADGSITGGSGKVRIAT